MAAMSQPRAGPGVASRGPCIWIRNSYAADPSRRLWRSRCRPASHQPWLRVNHNAQPLQSLRCVGNPAAAHQQSAASFCVATQKPQRLGHGHRGEEAASQLRANGRPYPCLAALPALCRGPNPAGWSALVARSMQQELEAGHRGAAEGIGEGAEEGVEEGGYGSDSDSVVLTGEAPGTRKLLRFDGRRSIREAVTNFRFEVSVEAGTLVVRPLTTEWLGRTADLLADVFATLGGAGFDAYRQYMRKQISGFLEMQLGLMPDAVVLIALLIPHSAAGGPGPSDSPSDSTSDSASGGTSDQGGVAAVVPGCEGSSQGLGQGLDPLGVLRSPSMQSQHRGLGTAEAPACLTAPAQSDSQAAGASSVSESPVGLEGMQGAASEAVAGPTDGAAEGASADGAAEGGEGDGSCGEAEPVLVGTFELAFTEETRTKFVTLNPPQDGAYLSNMCTGPDHRQRGYGKQLLAAAEQLTRLMSYHTIYLHNRFKDGPAGALYKQCGYDIADKDSVFWALVGQDRRYLLRKRVPSDNKSAAPADASFASEE